MIVHLHFEYFFPFDQSGRGLLVKSVPLSTVVVYFVGFQRKLGHVHNKAGWCDENNAGAFFSAF